MRGSKTLFFRHSTRPKRAPSDLRLPFCTLDAQCDWRKGCENLVWLQLLPALRTHVETTRVLMLLSTLVSSTILGPELGQ